MLTYLPRNLLKFRLRLSRGSISVAMLHVRLVHEYRCGENIGGGKKELCGASGFLYSGARTTSESLWLLSLSGLNAECGVRTPFDMAAYDSSLTDAQ